MANPKKKNIDTAEDNEQVKAGKKAIEVDKKVSQKGKSEQEKNDKEAKDAEQWRNEG